MEAFIEFPQFDPVILPIWGPVALRWYNLAYMVGIGFGWLYCARIVPKSPSLKGFNLITKTTLEEVVAWVIGGIVAGGRLGYVLFYQPSLFIEDPLAVFKLWEGGMSFHGAILGCTLATFIFARMHKVKFLSLTDILLAAAPIGMGLGRIANFINDELWGRPTTMPWAVKFPSGGYLPRHPSQLYEAFLEGLFLFSLLSYLIWKKRALKWPGFISGTFLIGYGICRYMVEFVRAPDAIFSLGGMILTIGQLLSLPLIIGGIVIMYYIFLRNSHK